MSRKRRLLLGVLTFLLVFAFVELTIRTTLALRYDYPFFTPRHIMYTYYPEVKPVLAADIKKNNNSFNVLLLGASVLLSADGALAKELQKGLARNLPEKKVQVYNVAASAHTSLDSWYKYQLLKNKKFDLVIFYHGINETRANNCPPEVFRPDYSHYAFYQETNLLMRHPEMNYAVLPYFLELIYLRIANSLHLHELVPGQAPRQDWLKYGQDFKTSASFAKNVNNIIGLAKVKSEKLMLLGFAYYVPANYTFERFLQKQLDYDQHISPIELWGLPQNVSKGIDGHNQILRQIAGNNSQILYTDINTAIPKNKNYFNDICHFNLNGCKIFVQKVVATLEKSPVSLK